MQVATSAGATEAAILAARADVAEEVREDGEADALARLDDAVRALLGRYARM